MHKLLIGVTVAALGFVPPVVGADISAQPQARVISVKTTGFLPWFPTERAAQKRCPNDHVVWLDLAQRTYYRKGTSQYGRGKYRAYVCRRDANAFGERESRSR